MEPVNLPINPDDIKEGDWVLVEYKEERFLGKVICVQGNEVQVRCLQKPYGIGEPKEFDVKKMQYSTKGFSMQMSTQK